ncbi:MAG: hypothetical protein N4J56_000881 [Chroococcidiopsis sp. SAG 2025]|uniref:hypothetical protein n=1 Tax=Chroococcidiopsis sp. SAG 2025 TaxID=171389 RepID=UPI002936EF94|nr:hypothetical protein [Chroococcidiopsis sp. SAG 2025]MDV2991227.1 hypothetical protein [Chroococcidiopsis sp. SAG 2025]
MTHQFIDTATHDLLELLADIIIEQEQYTKKITAQAQKSFLRLYNIGWIGFLICFIVTLLLATLIKVVFHYNSTDNITENNTDNIIRLLITIALAIVLGAMITFISAPTVIGVGSFFEHYKQPKQNLLNVIKEDTIFLQPEDERFIKIKASSYQTIESASKSLKMSIEVMQNREKLLDSFAPILPIAFVVVIYIILGVDIQNYKSPIAPAGSSAVISLIIIFWIKRELQVQIIRMKKCLFILEQVQAIAAKSEVNQNSEQLKKNNKAASLMSKLKDIIINNAPEDFAANHDLYISGEKQIESDIH